MSRAEWAVLGAAVVWITALLFFRWPALLEPVFISNSNIDSAFFAYAGELIRTGGTPYVSFWDHKAPLVHLINAGALTLSGGRVWGVWVVSWAVYIAAILIGHRTLRRAVGSSAAVLGTAYFALSLTLLLPNNLTEEYILPLQWAAVLLLFTPGLVRERPFAFGTLLGLVGGLSFFLRANLIGAPASAAVVVSVLLLSERRGRAWVAVVGGALIGAAAVGGAIVAYLAAEGAVAPFWDQAFRYNFAYSDAPVGQRVRAAASGLMQATVFGSFVLPLAGWLLAAFRLRDLGLRDRRSAVLLLGLVWLPAELLLASMSDRPYGHYFTLLLAPLALLAAVFAAEVALPIGSGAAGPASAVRSNRFLYAIVGSMAAVSVGVTLISLRDSATSDAPPRGAQVTATADYVRTHTSPGAPLLVWGHAADVHFFAGRRPASRFIYSLPLLTPGYADSALVRGFLREVRTAAPPLIVDATSDTSGPESLVPPLGRWDPAWRYPTDQGERIRWWSMTPALKEFYDFVAANYSVVDSVGPLKWRVYQRRAPLSAQR